MATGFDNFGSYEVGSLPAGILEDDFGTGVGAVTVEELANSLSGQALKFIRTSGNYKAKALLDVTSFGVGEVVALVRILAGETFALGQVLGRGLVTGTVDAAMGTRVQNSGAGFAYVAGSAGIAGTTFVPPNPYLGERIWMRFNWDEESVQENRVNIKQRMWNADDPEPETWDDESLDVANAGSQSLLDGKPGFYVNLQGSGIFGTVLWVEAIGWSDDPAVSAPLTGAVAASNTHATRERSRIERVPPRLWRHF